MARTPTPRFVLTLTLVLLHFPSLASSSSPAPSPPPPPPPPPRICQTKDTDSPPECHLTRLTPSSVPPRPSIATPANRHPPPPPPPPSTDTSDEERIKLKGKKLGILFAILAAALQFVFLAFLAIKRWQLGKFDKGLSKQIVNLPIIWYE